MTTTLAPTTKAEVNAHSYFDFNCQVELAETERIIITLNLRENFWDSGLNKYVTTIEPKKFQLESLSYGVINNQCSFTGGNIRGFRKDGALRFRENFIPSDNIQEALQQIPTHYHDYAIKAFDEEMLRIANKISTITNNGVKL